MTTPAATQHHLDPALFDLCVSAFAGVPATDDNHTVAAAVRSRRTGETVVALNVYHFTGGPCAELCVFGAAAARGVLPADVETIVAVCRRQDPETGGDVFRVINPCGRCGQTMLDYNPEISVIVLNREGCEVRTKARDLMVYPSIWEDGNTGREEKRKALEAEGKSE
ncbi:hypothetical protein C7999DRAFT_40872 [Corynascus novoguineensis]|uniref:Cytidine deaminase n=1 Tax=Corynascus novoguineensis TaxID=1126955 RepID=A0AAN7CTZ3_9PEZI|nr:hypothetical protein C7999DRAFT_40872 [Corynascus novoguineensis]